MVVGGSPGRFRDESYRSGRRDRQTTDTPIFSGLVFFLSQSRRGGTRTLPLFLTYNFLSSGVSSGPMWVLFRRTREGSGSVLLS